ncbi:phage virion morphogenesis protein [Candidatus Desantisbacteria bacterium]|nr:phage virion morphogenesis protein [Candidatus Desantisbacteria bacterium]
MKNNIKQIEERAKNMTPVMKIIGQIVRTSVVDNFAAGGRPEKWQPLKMISYVLGYTMGKKRQAYTKKGVQTAGFQRYTAGKKILITSGRLLGSINAKAYTDKATVETNVEYAARHQFGIGSGANIKSKRGFVATPARPFLMVQTQDWEEINNALVKFLIGGNA